MHRQRQSTDPACSVLVDLLRAGRLAQTAQTCLLTTDGSDSEACLDLVKQRDVLLACCRRNL